MTTIFHSVVVHFYCPLITYIRSVHQEDLVVNLKQFLTRDSIPEITQTVLNLAEFMEHCEEATVSCNICTHTMYIYKFMYH